jgi:NADPH:quinone reductase-like Zn-dependent oxidoreductase
MRALIANDYGPPAQLVVADADDPTPGPGQVLIRIVLRDSAARTSR